MLLVNEINYEYVIIKKTFSENKMTYKEIFLNKCKMNKEALY